MFTTYPLYFLSHSYTIFSGDLCSQDFSMSTLAMGPKSLLRRYQYVNTLEKFCAFVKNDIFAVMMFSYKNAKVDYSVISLECPFLSRSAVRHRFHLE